MAANRGLHKTEKGLPYVRARHLFEPKLPLIEQSTEVRILNHTTTEVCLFCLSTYCFYFVLSLTFPTSALYFVPASINHLSSFLSCLLVSKHSL